MIRPNPPDNWHDYLIDYALGNLNAEETNALQEQIAADPNLARALSEIEASLSALPYGLPQRSPAASLKSSLLEKAAESRVGANHVIDEHTRPAQSLQQPSKQQPSKRRTIRLQPLFGAIAASVAVAIGIDNLRLRQQVAQKVQLRQMLRENQAEIEQLRNQLQDVNTVMASLQEPRTILYSLIGTGPAEGATGSLVANPDHQHMVLVSENLPKLSNEQIYRLWAIADAADATASPEYCGQFRPGEDGTAQWDAPTNTCSNIPDSLLITLDRPNDPIDSAGPLIMQSQT